MKKAFTMLELVFVIVVAGILAAVIIPSTRTNPLQEAAIQVLSDIRYTQHLAMVDDKYDVSNANWYRARWQIFFQLDNSGNGNQVYGIYTDKDTDNNAPENGEMALDPLSGNQMTGNSLFTNRIESMDLTHRYGVANRAFGGGCAGSQRIMFDNLGRPHTDDNTVYGNLVRTACNVTLTHSDGTNIAIRIQPETGYTCILNDAATDCI